MDAKTRKMLDELELELPSEITFEFTYDRLKYRYFQIKDCYGNDYIVEELKRLTRWQWRVFTLNHRNEVLKDYYEVSGSDKYDFHKFWSYICNNSIVLSPN